MGDDEEEMTGEEAPEEKSGLQLFRELLCLLPTAIPEDYFKVGRWDSDKLSVDMEIIEAHRAEAGAPEPCAPEEVTMPPLPPGADSKARPPPPVRTMPAGLSSALGGARTAAYSPLAAASSETGGVGSVQADLRMVALFVAKNRLETTRTKILLARLTPPRRRWVIQNFRPGGPGVPPMVALEAFINECQENNAWDRAPAALDKPRATPGSFPPYSSSVGVKRNLAPGLQVAGAPPVKVARPATAKLPPVGSRASPQLSFGARSAIPKPAAALRSTSAPAASPRGSLGTLARPSSASSAARPATASGGMSARGSLGNTQKKAPESAAKPGGGAKPGDLIKNLLSF